MATRLALALSALLTAGCSAWALAGSGSPRFEFKLIAEDHLPAEMGVFVDCSDCERVVFSSTVTRETTLNVERRSRVDMTTADIEFVRIGEASFLRDPAHHYWVVEAVLKEDARERFLAVRRIYPLAGVLVYLEGRALTIDSVARWNAGIVLTKVAERGDAEEFAKDLGLEIREWWFLPGQTGSGTPPPGRNEGKSP